MKCDVAIIGGGTAGIMASYELNKNIPNLDILIIEQGNLFMKENAP